MKTRAKSVWAFPLEAYSYLDATREYHVTLADVLALHKGDVMDLVTFDRNMWDVVLDGAAGRPAENVAYSAATFFRNCGRATYVHDSDVHGTITFRFPASETSSKPRPFTWDMEHATNVWHPMRGALDVSTRVGFRGPCVLEGALSVMPSVFFVDPAKVQSKVSAQMKTVRLLR